MNLGAFAVVIAGARRTGTGDISGGRASALTTPRLGVLAAIFSLAGRDNTSRRFVCQVRDVPVGDLAGGTATVVWP